MLISEPIGGILHNGEYSWIALGSTIEIFSTKTGNKIGNFTFQNQLLQTSNCLITCVTEIVIPDLNTLILGIGIQYLQNGNGVFSIFSVKGSKILHSIEINEKVLSCCYYQTNQILKNYLQMFDGCLIIGTENGKVFIIDLGLAQCKEGEFCFGFFIFDLI